MASPARTLVRRAVGLYDSDMAADPEIRISSHQSAMRVPRKKMAGLVRYIARREKVALAEVDIAVVDDEQIEQLNRRHLRHAGTTDVLSFDLTAPGEPALSLQLIVCGPLARRVGPEHGLSPTRELLLYVAHGLLHQLGYDDQDPPAARTMRRRQMQLLEEFANAG
jgi:probable rRNA maturation factor